MAIQVIVTVPTNGQFDVYIDDPIRIEFNKELTDASLIPDNFILRRSDNSGRLYGAILKDPDNPNIIIFTPNSFHENNMSYGFTIKGYNSSYGIIGIESEDSEYMTTGNYYFEYRTGDKQRPVTPPVPINIIYEIPQMEDTNGDGIPDTVPFDEGSLLVDTRIPIPVYPGNMPHIYEGNHLSGTGVFELITGLFDDNGGIDTGIYAPITGVPGDVIPFQIDHTHPKRCSVNVISINNLLITYNQNIDIGSSDPSHALFIQRIPIWIDDNQEETLVENLNLSDDYSYVGLIDTRTLSYNLTSLSTGVIVDSEYIITVLPGTIRSAETGYYNEQEEIHYLSYITIRYATVSQVRIRLSPTLNAVYDDCQIDRLIAEESRFLYDYLDRPTNLTPRQLSIANKYIICIVVQRLQEMNEEQNIAQWSEERAIIAKAGRETILARLANIGIKSRAMFGLTITYDSDTLKSIASDPAQYSSTSSDTSKPFDSKARKCCITEDCNKWLNMLSSIVAATLAVRKGIKSGSTIKYPGRRRGIDTNNISNRTLYDPSLPYGGPNEDPRLSGSYLTSNENAGNTNNTTTNE